MSPVYLCCYFCQGSLSAIHESGSLLEGGLFLVNVSVNEQSYIFNSTVTVAHRDLLKVIKKNVQCLCSLQRAKQFAQGQNTQWREQATQC